MSTAAFPTTLLLMFSASTPDLSVVFTVTEVPEPAGLVLMGLAGCAIGVSRLRRRK